MKLKSLEMQGFKSFPEKTVLNFEAGFTAVVGPNGSGKSNISDAIRWVLGEISSKNIRGKKMEDIIFGGTDNRRQMGYCEVSLTIDNTDPENKMNIDYDEVCVTRRYYRSGDSEYYINREPVRLRDITELFLNTGLGKQGYSIIGQGRIADIISQKNDERRMMFEEAAGIAKYRNQKNEAERKLANTEENLVRINDIISELESRVGPLEKESEKAKKYLEIYNEKKDIDVAISLYDIDDIQGKTDSLSKDLETANNDLANADTQLENLENENNELFEKSQANKLRYEELNRLIIEANQKKSDYGTNAKIYENNISHTNEQIDELKKAVEELTANHTSALTKKEEITSLLATHKTNLDSLNTSNDELKNYISDKDQYISNLSDEIEQLELEIDDLNQQLVDAKVKLSGLEVSDKSGDDKKLSLQAEIDEIQLANTDLEDRVKKSIESVEGYQSNVDGINANIETLKEKEATANKKLLHLTDNIGKISIDIETKKHQIDTLSRMEETLEGYSFGVKNVINAQKEEKLSGICGPVSKVIETDSKYISAIESSLGPNLQNIIVEEDADAKAAIRYLKETKGGRATFYPISNMVPAYLDKDKFDFTTYNGYIGVANDLVNCDDKYRDVIDYLLCKTVVFDTIDNANAMAKASGYKLRTVTLDGQLINTGGSFTGGSAVRESGMLSRSNNIQKIKNEIKDLETQLSDLTTQKDEASKIVDDLANQITDAQANLSLFNSLISAENAQKEMLEAQLETNNNRIAAVNSSISDVTEEIEKAKNLYKQTETDIENLNNTIQKKNGDIEQKATERRETSSLLDTKRIEANDLLIKITSLEKDIEITEFNLDNHNLNIDSIISDIEKSQNQITNYENKLKEYNNKIKESIEVSSEIDSSLVEYKNEIESISNDNLTIEQKQSELRESTRELSHVRENLFRNQTKLESELNSILTEKENNLNNLWDEYELTYSDAKELQLPEINEENRNSIKTHLNELKGKLKRMGSVNVNAIEEYSEVKERYDFMKKQFDDLTQARSDLHDVIFKLEKEMREQFVGVFNQINVKFKKIFSELFGGGSANISLTDPENVLTSGIEIEVAPPGKIIKNLSLLSGGEQAFVAIALFFAIIEVNPTPFCVLDEIEAALDDVNVARFADYCKNYSDKTQFIVITHRRGTMEAADVLYGVTMYEKGISKVLSVNVSDVEKKIGVKL